MLPDWLSNLERARETAAMRAAAMFPEGGFSVTNNPGAPEQPAVQTMGPETSSAGVQASPHDPHASQGPDLGFALEQMGNLVRTNANTIHDVDKFFGFQILQIFFLKLH